MIFDGKCFSCYILLTDQISLPDCLYFLRHSAICMLKFFVSLIVTSLIFLIKPFSYMTKKLRQKFKYLYGEIKDVFYHSQRRFSCQKLSQTWECTFKNYFLASQHKNACSNWIIETPETGVKFIQWHWRVLVSLLLTLNICHTLFSYLICHILYVIPSVLYFC